jgi:hypothetical protein
MRDIKNALNSKTNFLFCEDKIFRTVAKHVKCTHVSCADERSTLGGVKYHSRKMLVIISGVRK